jgi:hypothetical protein
MQYSLKRLMIFLLALFYSTQTNSSDASELFCFTNNFKCSSSAPQSFTISGISYVLKNTGVMFSGPKVRTVLKSQLVLDNVRKFISASISTSGIT